MKSSLAARKMLAGIVAVFLLLGWPSASAAQPAPGEKPRLVVLVVVDQLRADYLVRFRAEFGAGGFNRLLGEGAYFTSCFYPYAKTNTGPGHATLATGTTPDRHGIVNNSWYDRERGRRVAAVFDEDAPLVGAAEEQPGVSPQNLMTATVADALRLATSGAAKVFGVSIKDRSAVFTTGHTASGAYWYDYATGRFITSRYYREALPAWVDAFNQRRPADEYYGQEWAEGDKTYFALGSESGAPDAGFYGQIPFTPYGNELVLQFARALVEQEELGADEVTDFLSIGLSANDFAGHRWGPYSEEVAAMTRATDRQLAALLAFLDEKVGAGKYWLALSADHGVAPALAQARARGLPAKSVDPRALLEAVEKALDDAWGDDEWLLPRAGLVFNREALKKHEVGVAQAAHVAGGAVMALEGVRGYVAGAETLLDAATTKAVRLSTYRRRTPDVFVVLEPFAMFGGEGRGAVAVHGTHYAYDQHVPLVFYGPAFRAGVYWERVATIDLAPTLAAALGLTPPALSSGKVLTQALRSE